MRHHLDQQVYDGEMARQVIENPVYQSVMGDMEQELIEAWKKSESVEDREKIHQYLMTLDKLRTKLSETFSQGKLANLEIQHKRHVRETRQYSEFS